MKEYECDLGKSIREVIKNPNIIGRITNRLAYEPKLTVHHLEEIQNAEAWLSEKNSLIIAYGPHQSIWDFPIPENYLTQQLFHGVKEPSKHALIASAKFDLPSSRRFKRLHVPHMGVGNAALTEYTNLMGISLVYVVQKSLEKKLISQNPEIKDDISEWARMKNMNAIHTLSNILDQDGAVIEYFPEGTRHNNSFIRSEPMLDILYAQFRHRKRNVAVLPIAIYGTENIQKTFHQGTILGINLRTNVDLDILPLVTFDQIREVQKSYQWNPPEFDPEFEKRVFMSDIVVKMLSASNVVESPQDRQGIYSNLIQAQTILPTR